MKGRVSLSVWNLIDETLQVAANSEPMTPNPLERYQHIRTTIAAMAESAGVLVEHLIAEGKWEVAPEVAQMVAHTAAALTHQAIDKAAGRNPEDIDSLEKAEVPETDAALPTMSRTVGRRSGAIACQRGCDCCCYLNVPVSKPEARLIAYHLRRSLTEVEQKSLTHRIRKTAQHLESVEPGDRLSQKIPCVFLIGGQCLVHPVRPASCRDHHSINLSACEESFGTGRWAAPGSDKHDLVANSATVAIAEACTKVGFDSSFGELHAELLAALDFGDPLNVPPAEPQRSSDIRSLATSAQKSTSLTGQPLSQDLIQDLASDLIKELSHKHNLAAEAIVDWGNLDGPEESDDLSLFKRPISAYFFDAHGSDAPGSSTFHRLSSDQKTFGIKNDDLNGSLDNKHPTQQAPSSKKEQEIDETELEDLIQEMVTEISQEECRDGNREEFWRH